MRRFVLALCMIFGIFVQFSVTDQQAYGQKGGGGLRPVAKTIDVDVNTADDVKVRTIHPPSGEFDEKGNVKKPSNAELSKMKGDTPEERRLPGYKIELSSLKNGDIVKVSIGKAKEAPKSLTGKTDDKPAKVTYTHMGDLVGTVAKVSGSHLTIKVTSTTMQSGRNYGQNNQKGATQTLDDKLVATMIIVEQSAPDNKNNKGK